MIKALTKIGNYDEVDRHILLAIDKAEVMDSAGWIFNSAIKFLAEVGRIDHANKHQ